MHQSNKPAEQTSLRYQLRDILLDVSWGQLASKHFASKVSWLYERIDGVDSGGEPVSFSPEERETLRNALYELADRIRSTADRIH